MISYAFIKLQKTVNPNFKINVYWFQQEPHMECKLPTKTPYKKKFFIYVFPLPRKMTKHLVANNNFITKTNLLNF